MLSTPAPRPASTDTTFFSSKSTRTIAPTVTVTSRITRRPAPPVPAVLVRAPSPPPKRKAAAHALPRQVKRLRTEPEPARKKRRAPVRGASRVTSSPEPIYRSSRSRSVSAFGPSVDQPVQRDWRWPEGMPLGKPALSAEDVVRRLMRSYKAYFKNLDNPQDRSFQPNPIHYPWVELEYPNTGATERFILLAPKDKDHYNPIMCLEKSLCTIVEHYLTPAQQSLFGSIPTDILSEAISPPPSPSPSPPNSQGSSCSTSSLSSLSSSSSSLSSLSSLSSTHSVSPPAPRINYLRAIQRAIHRQDGPLFVKTMKEVNKLLQALKYPALPADPFAPHPVNALQAAVARFSESGLPKKVLMRIIEENYQRSVGPNVQSLRNYEAFSSRVYGELMPSLVYEIIAATGLTEDMLFLDLGSGVGNVVVQASLQTGCRSFGIELMPAPARVAREQVAQFTRRCRMWGLRVGEVELEEGDMVTSRRVDELIAQADVVLVDNKVFEESLNEQLRPKFLDLKEGARVVSLKPFVSSLNARVTERNVDDISAIFDVTEHAYHSGSVSWGNGGGSYYIHRVDRTGYAQIRARFESTRGTRARR